MPTETGRGLSCHQGCVEKMSDRSGVLRPSERAGQHNVRGSCSCSHLSAWVRDYLSSGRPLVEDLLDFNV